jgi:uncharacterized protein YbjT (DUF2867 family)
VGTERLQQSGYFRAKAAQEKLIESSPVPYSIVHATQFFEFVSSITDGATVDDAVHLAHVLFQPIASDDVATAVARVAGDRRRADRGVAVDPGRRRSRGRRPPQLLGAVEALERRRER